MSNDSQLTQIPRNVQARIGDILADFTEDAAVNNSATRSGLHDVLERNHGLHTIDSRRGLTSSVQLRAGESANLNSQIRTRKDLADRVQQLIANGNRGRAATLAEQNALDQWKHAEPNEMLRHGLDKIVKFVTNNPSILPDLLDTLKPMEDKCRSGISDASKNIAQLLNGLSEMQGQCKTLQRASENHVFEELQAANETNGMSEQVSAIADELKDLKARHAYQMQRTQKAATRCKELEEENKRLKDENKKALESRDVAKATLESERQRLEEGLSANEEVLQRLRREHESALRDAQGISKAMSMEQSTDELSRLLSNALSSIMTHMAKCGPLEREKDRIQKSLDAATKDAEDKQNLLNSLSHISIENQEQRRKLAEQSDLIAKLPSLDEYRITCQRLRESQEKAQSASHSGTIVAFCSMALATISACENDDRKRTVDITLLATSWKTATEWSGQNTSSLVRRQFRSVVHGLVSTADGGTGNDALNLARLLLVRAHTSPACLSVALLEQLAAALETAGEMMVTKAMGFVYALLQLKGPNSQSPDSWSFSRGLLVVRCLSLLASYVQETRTCSRLATIAQSVRGKVRSSILVRAMLEHVIKLLSGTPEYLGDTLARTTFARRVKTRSLHTVYPDGQDLIVVDGGNNVAFVRSTQFDWDQEDVFRDSLRFREAPMLGTCQIMLPSIVEEMHLYDIFHATVVRAEGSQPLTAHHPDYTFIVE